ncbi:SET and MYND domain-containing protein 4-like [Anopheles maculipalpis]|uniref:SET and MYND domain-containing protein 4-like n=1 Tax=Anopheles maculipalpis TaxID=1496333 RepID=UPI002158AF62|nr:SET and MYND domain-containing protein 4-like [Anopheles maculipalpis]
MEPEGPPELVASRSCRNDKKLVAFILEQRMKLNESCSPTITFYSNVKNNIHALWFYNYCEYYITHYSSSWPNTTKLKMYLLVQLNLLIAYSTPGSKQLTEGYLKRARIAYASEEDFCCLYNILHAKEVNTTHFATDASAQYLFYRALVRKNEDFYPSSYKSQIFENHLSQVECKESIQHGRYLYARRSLPTGSTALREMPYASVLMNDFWVRCHHCLNYAPFVLIPCQSCSLAMFCSVTCRTRACEEYHSMECAIMPILIGQCTPIEFLALRLTIRVYKMFPITSDALVAYIRGLSDDVRAHDYSAPDAKANYRKIYRLATNRRHLSKQTLTYDGLRAVSLAKMFVREHKLPTSFEEILAELTVRHLHILRVNALVLHCSKEDNSKEEYNSTSEPYALVLLTTGSMFNHSCNANVEYHLSRDGEIVFVTNTYIPKGSQMYIDYRINPLDSRYVFECYCHQCASKRVLSQLSFVSEYKGVF